MVKKPEFYDGYQACTCEILNSFIRIEHDMKNADMLGLVLPVLNVLYDYIEKNHTGFAKLQRDRKKDPVYRRSLIKLVKT